MCIFRTNDSEKNLDTAVGNWIYCVIVVFIDSENHNGYLLIPKTSEVH